MFKALVLFLALLISSVSAQSVKDAPPKKGTPEEFVVNFFKKINSSSMTFEEFKKDICSKNTLKEMGDKLLKIRYDKIKLFDLEKKFEYSTNKKDGYTEVLIIAGRKNTFPANYYVNVKKIDGSFRWMDLDKD